MCLKDVLDITPDIGLNDYPIFDETYRETLNKKIIDRYWNREIGLETISMFVFHMKRKMNEIMPFYNQRYLSTQLKFDPLSTVNICSVSDGTATQNTTGHSTSGSGSDAQSRAVAQDLPQTTLADNGDYASSAQDNVSHTSATGTADETGTMEAGNKNTSHTHGYQGPASVLLMQYRDSIINVDVEILTELEKLFMLVWDNGDSFTERNHGFDYFSPYSLF
jgi:hypothetical protein